MPHVGVIAKLIAQTGKREELSAALRQAVLNTEDEPGTLQYILLADTKQEDVLWFYELYSDQDALQAHMSTDGFKALGAAIGPFLAGRPELNMVEPVVGKGLPD